MNKLKLAALGLIAFGIAVLAVGAINGEGELIILLFIPVYRGSGPYALGGGLLIFLGIVLGLIYFFKKYAPMPYQEAPGTSRSPAGGQGAAPAGKPKTGGVVFLGPIPLVWGSDAKTTLYAIIIGIIIVTTVLVSIFLYFVFNTAFP
jgi:uncharacterized protein (TIGR00304 family)